MTALRELVYGIQNAKIEIIGGEEFYVSKIGVDFQQKVAAEFEELEEAVNISADRQRSLHNQLADLDKELAHLRAGLKEREGELNESVRGALQVENMNTKLRADLLDSMGETAKAVFVISVLRAEFDNTVRARDQALACNDDLAKMNAQLSKNLKASLGETINAVGVITQLRADKKFLSEEVAKYIASSANGNTENKKLCDLLAERYETYLKVCAEAYEMRETLDGLLELPHIDTYSYDKAHAVLEKYPVTLPKR
ncbi:MAG: hypothetical protein IMZ52_00295 [Actinobacteria bacterium]|nr:hypothetical protein [Actinomycetota bacterium]